MQEFFMDYGLWLLIALLVIIGVVFLLSGRRKPAEPPAPVEAERAAAFAASASVPVMPVAPQPVPASPMPPVTVPEAVAPANAAAAQEGEATADDLLKMKGIGPKLNALLIELGVTRYAQIASWSEADIAAIDAKLGNFRGRPVRDQWVDQARYLAAGDAAGFEAKYGKL